MTTGITVGTASGNKAVSELWVGTATGNKEITEGWVGTATGNKQFYASEAFTADASPDSQVWSPVEGGTYVASVSCVAAGGSGGYTYAWELQSGDAEFDTPSSSSTLVGAATAAAVTVRCLVTDSSLNTVYSDTITISGT